MAIKKAKRKLFETISVQNAVLSLAVSMVISQFVVHALLDFKNKLQRGKRYTDAVDEVMIKAAKDKKKSVNIA